MTTGDTMNGIIKIGFNTIGIPKINGSLMLNIAGPIANLPNVLNWLDFATNKHNNASPKVAPAPPILMKFA